VSSQLCSTAPLLTAGTRRLIVVDDVDLGGQEAVDEALMLANRAGDGSALAEVLDARLYALWDPAGAQDRLDAASELIRLGLAAGDGARERDGLFWRFVALMELARVDEAEVALAAFERAAAAAGDAEASVMGLSRHGMLAILRGRFEVAAALGEQVAERARRIGMPDAERLAGTVTGPIIAERGDERSWEAAAETFDRMARRFPGHLYEALLPYRGRLVVLGGANAVNGPASHYLGLLAARLGRPDDAVAHFEDAIGLAERIGARPALARSLTALGETLSVRGGDGDARRSAGLLRRGRELAGELGLTSLIRRRAGAPGEWALRRDGGAWLLEAGGEHARLADSRGLQQLRALLAAPRRDIPALDLAAGGPGLRAPAAPPVLDPPPRRPTGGASASSPRSWTPPTPPVTPRGRRGPRPSVSGSSRSCGGRAGSAAGCAAPPPSPSAPG
jgi:hypothetical protein